MAWRRGLESGGCFCVELLGVEVFRLLGWEGTTARLKSYQVT